MNKNFFVFHPFFGQSRTAQNDPKIPDEEYKFLADRVLSKKFFFSDLFFGEAFYGVYLLSEQLRP